MILVMTDEGAARRLTREERALVRLQIRYVAIGRRYLKLLGGNFQSLPGWKRFLFLRALRFDARRISDDQLRTLLRSEWRSRLTAAWFIGISRREHFVDELGDLLTESAVVFSGEGYAFAMAAIGGPGSVAQLARYLDEWLPRVDARYDQDWVMGALAYLDAVDGTEHAARYLADGSWQRWADDDDLLAEMTTTVRDAITAVS